MFHREGDPVYQGWLNEVPQALASKLIAISEAVTVEAGGFIYQIGDATHSLWCIQAAIIRMNIATNEDAHRFGRLIGPGFWFGEFELLTGHPRLIEMQAATDCDLLKFSKTAVEKLAMSEPQLWRWIAILSAQHTLLALSAADDLMLRKPIQRAAALLLRLSENRAAHPASVPRTIVPILQQDLSDALNISRSTAGLILRQMESDKAISLEYRAVKILDVKKLKTYLADL